MKPAWRICAFALISSLSAPVLAQSVAESQGDIVYTDARGTRHKLTDTGKDSQPGLAPDGKSVIFVREPADQSTIAGANEVSANAIWWVDTEGKTPRKLVQSMPDNDSEKFLGGLNVPQFSPDGRTVYFLSSAWVTSDAVHKVDVASGKIAFVAPGNSLEVVPAGEYKGHLIVQKHKYFLGSGSYDWYWLLTADGKEVGPIGDSLDAFREQYMTKSGEPSGSEP